MADDENEDWFERAVREAEEEEAAAAEAAAEETTAEETTATGGGETEAESDADGADGQSSATDAGMDVADDVAVEGDDAATEDDPMADTEDAGEFGFGQAEDADGGGDGEPAVGRESEFGSTPAGDAEMADDAESDDGLFEQDFASALSDAPDEGFGEDRDFGFGGGGDTESFDDDDLDSEIPRLQLGIEGLDNMIQGGVPERSLIVCMGSAGTGKTTFGLQFLNEALENDERAVFITLEESHDRILSTAAEKGWDFPAYAENDALAVIDLDPVEMANSLTSIRDELPELIEEFGATRLVLDSVSLLEMMYDDRATRRTEVYDFTKSLKRAGVTTMVTSEARDGNPFASRYGIIEYLTDAVFVMRYIRPEDFRETRLAIEIQKIRDANHSRATKPYEITDQGLSVYRQANIF